MLSLGEFSTPDNSIAQIPVVTLCIYDENGRKIKIDKFINDLELSEVKNKDIVDIER